MSLFPFPVFSRLCIIAFPHHPIPINPSLTSVSYLFIVSCFDLAWLALFETVRDATIANDDHSNLLFFPALV
jgi:hypothetical protein